MLASYVPPYPPPPQKKQKTNRGPSQGQVSLIEIFGHLGEVKDSDDATMSVQLDQELTKGETVGGEYYTKCISTHTHTHLSEVLREARWWEHYNIYKTAYLQTALYQKDI